MAEVVKDRRGVIVKTVTTTRDAETGKVISTEQSEDTKFVVGPATVVITLKMSLEVAAALRLLARGIGGHPKGLRGVFSNTPNSILKQLDSRHVAKYLPTVEHPLEKGETIYFRDDVKVKRKRVAAKYNPSGL